MQLLAVCAATRPFLLFGILFSVTIGNSVVRTTFTLGYVFLGAHFGEYYVITVLWDVRNLTFVVWEKHMKHITPEMIP
jgi:hypothetical protein